MLFYKQLENGQEFKYNPIANGEGVNSEASSYKMLKLGGCYWSSTWMHTISWQLGTLRKNIKGKDLLQILLGHKQIEKFKLSTLYSLHVIPFGVFLSLFSFLRLICYDFVSSSTLKDFLCEKGTVLDFDAVCAIAYDVISAIERLQDLGILHNNITTNNILIGECSRVSKPICFFHVLSFLFLLIFFC